MSNLARRDAAAPVKVARHRHAVAMTFGNKIKVDGMIDLLRSIESSKGNKFAVFLKSV